MQPNAESFPALIGKQPRALLLGSMPGQASLGAQQYYAHPRNTFWWVMSQLFGIPEALPYQQRCELLTQHPLAVWDVLAQCHRPGSLDSAIEPRSAKANDFASLLRQHPTIRCVFFNGATAESLFKRLVIPTLPTEHPLSEFTLQRLPSTSPAHASLSREQKLTQWQALAKAVHPEGQDTSSATIVNTN